MTTMKKLLAMALSALLLLGTLTGCGGSGGQPEATEAPDVPEATAVPAAPETAEDSAEELAGGIADEALQADIQVPLYDDGEVQIRLTGMEVVDNDVILFHVEMANDSDVDVSGLVYDTQVNGADAEAYWDLDTMEAGQSGSFDMYLLDAALTDGTNDILTTLQLYIINESMDLLCDAPVELTVEIAMDGGEPTAAIGASLKGEPAGRDAGPEEGGSAPVDEFERYSFDETLITSDPVTLSSGSRSVSLSLPTEYAVFDSFAQSNSNRVMMTYPFATGRYATFITFEDETDPEEYIELCAEDAAMGYPDDLTDVQQTDLMHDTFNGFDVTWFKFSAVDDNDGRPIQIVHYYAAANIGTYILAVNMEYGQYTDREFYVDDDIIETIFNHVTDLGAGDGAAAAETVKPASLGVVDGNTFTSDSFGLSFTIGDGWRFYSDEELQAVGETSDTAVWATSESSIQSISLFMSSLQGVYSSSQIMGVITSQYDADPEGYMQKNGMDGGTMTVENVTIGGQEVPTHLIEVSVPNGHVVYERAIYRAYHSGDGTTDTLMITLSCADNKDLLSDMLNMITFAPEG